MIMGKQHETIPNEPQESPVRPLAPEIQRPGDPQEPQIPAEAPDRQPEEVPQHPQQQPEAEPGKTNEAKERATGEGTMQDSVAAELKNRQD